MEPGAGALLVGVSAFGIGLIDGDGSSASVELYKDGPSRAEGPFLFAVGAEGLRPAPASRTQAGIPRSAGEALLLLDPALSPYDFGTASVDPAADLRAALNAAVGRASLAEALWAAVESELFRYAFDEGFTAALEAMRDRACWLRFARLNDLYRGLATAIAPLGIVPGSWTERLRGSDAPKTGALGRLVERVATRPVGAAARVLSALAEPGSLFRVDLPVTVH